MTEAIYIVEGGVNPDHYEKYLVDCAVLGGTIAYDLYKFNENSPTSGRHYRARNGKRTYATV
jgi:hypothetical protein